MKVLHLTTFPVRSEVWELVDVQCQMGYEVRTLVVNNIFSEVEAIERKIRETEPLVVHDHDLVSFALFLHCEAFQAFPPIVATVTPRSVEYLRVLDLKFVTVNQSVPLLLSHIGKRAILMARETQQMFRELDGIYRQLLFPD
jgi:hypothetical protein